MRTVRQQVRVHDYYVEHMVNLQLNIEPGSNMSESVKVTAVGDQLQVIQVDQEEYQIRVIKLDEREVMGPGVKHVEYDYQLDFN